MAGKKREPGNSKPRKTRMLQEADRPLPNINPPAPDHDPPTESLPFPVICVGASAGGLDALSELLRAMPVDTGMAVVVIQHLAPDYPSMLSEILGRATRMPVRQADHHMEVEPNHVYVIPPDRNMLIAHGRIELSPRVEIRGLHMPIDHFLRSLAEEQGHKSIGIILSGSSSDGTLGLQEIKAAGGITFAQDDTAQHGTMPRSAVAAGCVDFVLPPAEIGRELGRISRHPYVAVAAVDAGSAAARASFGGILDLLRHSTDVDFSNYKRNTLHRRITRRMVLQRLDGLPEYLELLRKDPAELEALYQDILISVTSFFRNPEAFDALKERIFPRLVESLPRSEALRIWVLGCSTGEEAYSIAMAYLEFAETRTKRVPAQVFATDLNGVGVEKARAGVYAKGITQDVSPERLRRFFVEVDGHYRIAKSVRDMCVFAKQNVISDPPFSRMDLIACRNMLIYLEPVLQQRLLPVLHYALRNHGYLWLGTSETIGSFRDLFAIEDTRYKLYSKMPGAERKASAVFRVAPKPPPRAGSKPEFPEPVAVLRDPHKEADRVLLARYAPPGVVVNGELEIVQFRGDTGPFLTPAPGRASLSLLKMLREGLLVGVRGAVHKARRTGAPALETGLRVKANGGYREVDVRVLPMREDGASVTSLLVLFEPPARPAERRKAAPRGAKQARAAEREGEKEVARLKQELAALREYLQSVIEQQEAANEELQSANEEVQSANEELQSINEELETSKEEIQSSNEELATVNEELQNRNLELNQSNNDLNNLLGSVQMAMLMLGRDLRIRRFNAAAEKLLNLIAADVGRPLTDFNLKFNVPDLHQVLLDAIDNVKLFEREVLDPQGRWFSLRIHPYRTSDNRIDGAVIVLVDIDRLKRSQEKIDESEDRFRLLADSAPVLIWLIEGDGAMFVNRAYREFLGVPQNRVQGHNWANHVHPEDREHYLRVYNEAAARQQPFERQFRFRRADGEYRWMKSVALPRHSPGGEFIGYAGCTMDVQDMKDAERSLLDSDRKKNEFLAILSHELRNPLATITSAVEVIKQAGTNREVVEQASAIMQRQTQHMVRMVNDLLDITRITQGRVQIRKEPIEVARSIKRAIASTEYLRAAKRQQLETDLAHEPMEVSGDAIRLEQIVGNLLDNASKFSPPQAKLFIGLARDAAGGQAVIRVRDEGAGIEPGMLTKIFELFVRGSGPALGVDGVGIGLALARQLVELHGGTIEAKSAGLDQGSEFILRLPLLAGPQPDASPQELAPSKSKKLPPEALRRILIIDDNKNLARILSVGLQLNGHEVATVNDPKVAVETARSFRPDVILLDIGMPGMDGYDVARRLREEIPVDAPLLIAMTGYAREEDVRQSRDAGFDLHLKKPVDHDELNRVIQNSPVRHPLH